jgi:hypothetical protein
MRMPTHPRCEVSWRAVCPCLSNNSIASWDETLFLAFRRLVLKKEQKVRCCIKHREAKPVVGGEVTMTDSLLDSPERNPPHFDSPP